MTEQGHNPNVQTINVNTPRRGSSLGIASLILGILALAICWIPILGVLGMPMSGLGLLLGIVGFIIALIRKGSGIGFPIAGSLVSAIALIVAIAVNAAVAGVTATGVAVVGEALDQTAAVMNEARDVGSVESPAIGTGRSDAARPTKPSGVDEPLDKNPASTRKQPDVARPPSLPKWAPATKPIEHGRVRVEVVSVKTGRVQLVQAFDGASGQSKNPLLQIELEITNLSDARKLDYRTWAGADFSFNRDFATLRDNFGNTYKRISFSGLSKPKGGTERESIYPGKAVSDLLVFELPIDKVQHLDLELPAENAGEKGMIRLRIPAEMINASDRPPAAKPPERPLPSHDIVKDEPVETRAKFQVTMHVAVVDKPSKAELRRLLRHVLTQAREHRDGRGREPSIVSIAAYSKKCYHDESGGSWIGLLNYNARSKDGEPTITVDSDRLKAQFERSRKRHGLSTKKRKEVYRKLVEAEDRAMKRAGADDPTKYDANAYGRYLVGYKKKILKKYKITEKQADQIAREGSLKNWPMG